MPPPARARLRRARLFAALFALALLAAFVCGCAAWFTVVILMQASTEAGAVAFVTVAALVVALVAIDPADVTTRTDHLADPNTPDPIELAADTLRLPLPTQDRAA